MSSRGLRRLVLLPLVALAGQPSSAHAEPAPANTELAPAPANAAEQAAELKRQGDVAMESRRYPAALAAYEKAQSIAPDPALLYNAGRALEAMGRFPEALEKIEAFDRTAPRELKARVPALAALIAELQAHVSRLTIVCNVDGARVLVRNSVIGKTPLQAPVALASGKATIEIDADGHFPFMREIELPGGGNLVMDAQLGARNATGLLSIRTTVPGSDVMVDGRPLGVAPVETFVPAGSHRIAAWHTDWQKTETTTTIAVGERKELTLSLTKEPGLTSKWWFWAGVGAVVVTGAVVTTALLTERQAGSGDIAPGRISGPLMLQF